MDFLGNNSYYDQQDTELHTEIKPNLYPDAKQQGFLDPYIPLKYAYLTSILDPPEPPSIQGIMDDCNDGCTYKEILCVCKGEDKLELINNPSPNIDDSMSGSSSFDHQSNLQTKQKRSRRPSVRFVELLNKKKLSLGERVYYRKKNKKEWMGVGTVRQMGIECNCCGNTYSMSKFEEHVVLKFRGKVSHRAPTHIYLENGISLEKLQLEISQERSH